jgi:NhaP-type Na+/H+ or K+/H+ antiporter
LESNLIGLVAILALGIGAQWIAWKLGLPAILLLLVFGVLAGPITGIINPDQLAGDLLLPGVSLAVAVILFEGGLSLRLRDLDTSGGVVWRLMTVGSLVTWLLAAIAAYWTTELGAELSVLMGAILVVTGPTVIVPLLRHVRLRKRVASVVKWEGILNDPIGAILAVLVFEGILAGTLAEATTITVLGLFKSLLVGAAVGLAGAVALTAALKRYYVPDFLESPLSLTAVGAVFLASNSIQAESGLLAVTLMGVALAAQPSIDVRNILEFKENLRVLLISTLFIVLSARLELSNLQAVALPGVLFLAALVLVVRPVSVFAATLFSPLTWAERAMLMCLAPRGIVAAAVSTVFALRLQEAGFAQADMLAALVFFVIAGTILLYSVPAPWIADALGVREAQAEGVLLLGAHPWARAVAKALQEQHFQVLLIDSNFLSVRAARMAGLSAYYGNIVSEEVLDRLDLDGIGKMLGLTPNYAANSLAAIHLSEIFGRSEVYQLAPEEGALARAGVTLPLQLRGRLLFGPSATYSAMTERFEAGATVKTTLLTAEFGFEAFRERYGEDAMPLFAVTAAGTLKVIATDQPPELKAGTTLIALVDEAEDRPSSGRTKA